MERFIIHGGIPLQGEVTPAGNKNAALPLLAACMLTEEPVILHNVPQIRDVLAMRRLLESLGVAVETLGDHSWKLHAKEIRPADLDPEQCRRIRASILWPGRLPPVPENCTCPRPVVMLSAGGEWTPISWP